MRVQTLHPAGLGQGRDSINPFDEDRIRIWEQSWRARDREESGTSAPDPGRVKTCTDEKSLEFFFLGQP